MIIFEEKVFLEKYNFDLFKTYYIVKKYIIDFYYINLEKILKI